MYKSDLVDIDYELEDFSEPSFDIEKDCYLELDLVSQCID